MFLRVALNSPPLSSDENLPSTSSNPAWCFSSAFPKLDAYEAFDALFRPTISLPLGNRPPSRQWKVEIDTADDEEHFVFNHKFTQFESVDTSYTLLDLHNAISSTTFNNKDLVSLLADRQSDFEMVCFTSHVSL